MQHFTFFFIILPQVFRILMDPGFFADPDLDFENLDPDPDFENLDPDPSVNKLMGSK